MFECLVLSVCVLYSMMMEQEMDTNAHTNTTNSPNYHDHVAQCTTYCSVDVRVDGREAKEE